MWGWCWEYLSTKLRSQKKYIKYLQIYNSTGTAPDSASIDLGVAPESD